MNRKLFVAAAIVLVFLLSASVSQALRAQIPNQLAQDFVAGEVPSSEAIKGFEKEVAAKPDDLRATRRLGKAYFFQFFGDNDASAVPKAEKLLVQALKLQPDDPETLAYRGSLEILKGNRLFKTDPAKQKAAFDRGFEFVQRAEKLGGRNGAVTSVASATYLFLPDSYGTAPHVVEMLEGMIKGMGPMFKQFAHHGQQRLLLTLGQAYVRTGQNERARTAFEDALKVDTASDEAGLLKAELAKLKPAAATVK